MSYERTEILPSSSVRPPPSYDEALGLSAPNLSPAGMPLVDDSIGENQPLLQTDNLKRSRADAVVVDIYEDGNVLTEESFEPPEYSLSDASYERSTEGVVSYDPKINQEAESLHRFFLAHNDKPEMAVIIHGTRNLNLKP
jgi:hypothetical protein